MPYYAGDYYTGDYYRGDNYAAGGLFGKIGGLLGGVVKTVGRALIPAPIQAVARAVSSVVRPSPRPGFQLGPQGFGGGFTGGPMLEGGFGRRRRMNPLNIKALRRAMRRAKGFEKQARRVGTFFNPEKTFRLKGRGRRRAK